MWVEKQLVGGRMLPVERRLAWVLDNFRFRIERSVGRLAFGVWTVAQFQEWGRQEIKDTLYTVAETGAGRRLTRKEVYEVRRTLKEQVKFWDRFASDIVGKMKALNAKGLEGAEHAAAREKVLQGILRRAKSYSGAIEAEGQKWLLASRYEDGQWFEWGMNPGLENCATCEGRDKKRYQMKNGRLPFYPRDGSTICLFNCGCGWGPVTEPKVAKARGSRTATGRKGEATVGKKGEKGRFVTLRSGQVIFIPEGKRTKWADVREDVLARVKERAGKEYPLAEGAKRGGFGDPGAIDEENEMGHGISRPILIEFADGSMGIYKDDARVLVSYGNPEGEVLAYEFSEALGWDIVPETIRMEGKPVTPDEARLAWQAAGEPGALEDFAGKRPSGVSGTLQEYVHDAWTWEEMINRRANQVNTEAPEIVVMDAILGNHDRHTGNILEDESGRIHAIDNNGAFGFMDKGRQEYIPATLGLEEAMDSIWPVLSDDDPGLFMRTVGRYQSAFEDVRRFADSPKFGAFEEAIRNRGLGQGTADQFRMNVMQALDFPERSQRWKNAVARAEELEEESGGDPDWGGWD